ncbi:MFS family permease [Inhella inkyongensis]|uniref:MFS family permease n=1 Tax=Inhella inkyongensis TaxID=392593 RepID=A0A840S5R5_9BURK|nr:MFS transporter [Inhella inkyongensis]MBB5203829.1 MFS family permease [Inhella inkyongensis]
MQTLALDATARRRADWSTISLIGLAHGTSHFFHLLLPPLFPVFAREFGLSWTEMGLLVTVFYAVSGIGQALSGFWVDRYGARPALMVAMLLFAAGALAAGLAQGYGGLILAASLAGLGNAPMHPADFSVLNQRVAPNRLGHAYSVHGISGNLGWSLMPVLALAVLGAGLHWRWVYACAAAVALGVLGLLWWHSDRLALVPAHRQRAQDDDHALAFLRLPAVWLCFSFFLFTTAALAALQSFAPAALAALHGVDAATLSLVVTAYMLCGALGMLLGGFWVARSQRLERNIALALAAAMGLLLLATLPGLNVGMAATLVAVTGIGTGLAGPSRDLLVKQAAPAGATGRVYGAVYSGLDIGFSLAAPLAGLLLDAGWPRGVFWLAAAALGLALLAAQAVVWASARRSALG